MTRRHLIAGAVTFLAVLALFLSLTPFIGSLAPTDAAKDRYALKLSLAELPSDSFVEFEWQGKRVFVAGGTNPLIYWMPYRDGEYLLPDLTWQRAYIPCKTFEYIEDQFQCTDSEYDWWREKARWNKQGQAVFDWFEPLQTLPHHVKGEMLVVGFDA